MFSNYSLHLSYLLLRNPLQLLPWRVDECEATLDCTAMMMMMIKIPTRDYYHYYGDMGLFLFARPSRPPSYINGSMVNALPSPPILPLLILI